MDPRDREPVRTTIVGGQPEVRTKSSLPIPDGIEQAIERAAADDGFHARLLDGRADAAREAGIELSASEALLLSSVSEAQLNDLIDQAAPPTPRRHFLQTAVGWMGALLGGAALTSGCKRKKKRKKTPPTPTRGIEPDIPAPIHEEPAEPETPKPQPTRGIRPDVPEPISKGSRPDVPEDDP